MEILIYPVDIEDKICFDKVHFVNWVADERWSKIFEGKAIWYEELQDEFETLCERYWAENPSIEEGMFYGGDRKEAFFEKMRRELEPKIANCKDIRDRNSAKRVYDAAILTDSLQAEKVAICEYQLTQSQKKKLLTEAKARAATERWNLFATVSGNSEDDF